jgi:predicted Rossmann fold nucleotide-binding protein DprA/Smf involved in DNA uptake
MLSSPRHIRTPVVRVPAIRWLTPGEPLYPVPDASWQGWTGSPALFEPDAPAPLIALVGDPGLLRATRIAMICSAHCPGSIALETYRIARNALPGGPAVIGGFHSPMEHTVFDLLTTRHAPVIVCPGRRIQSRSIPLAWAPAIAEGRLAVLSPFAPEQKRVDRERAGRRNAFVAALADTVFVPYVRPGGAVASLVMTLLEAGKRVLTVEDRETEGLVVLGARAVKTDELIALFRGPEGGRGETQDPGLAGRDPLMLQ